MRLGQAVKEIREDRGYLQKEIAIESGISQATISRIESGKINAISSDRLKRLAEALQTTPDTLLRVYSSVEWTCPFCKKTYYIENYRGIN